MACRMVCKLGVCCPSWRKCNKVPMNGHAFRLAHGCTPSADGSQGGEKLSQECAMGCRFTSVTTAPLPTSAWAYTTAATPPPPQHTILCRPPRARAPAGRTARMAGASANLSATSAKIQTTWGMAATPTPSGTRRTTGETAVASWAVRVRREISAMMWSPTQTRSNAATRLGSSSAATSGAATRATRTARQKNSRPPSPPLKQPQQALLPPTPRDRHHNTQSFAAHRVPVRRVAGLQGWPVRPQTRVPLVRK